MNFMLSGLLKDLVGAKRTFHVNELVDMADSGLELAESVEGEVHMTRTARGVLVAAHLHTLLRQVCGRCLEPVLSPVDLDFEEEFLPTLDLGTGQPLDLANMDQEDPAILIDGHHVVDLDNIIRQYLLAWAPMRPLCRDDCAGLCPQCGADLNEERCACPPPVADSRLAALASLIKPEKGGSWLGELAGPLSPQTQGFARRGPSGFWRLWARLAAPVPCVAERLNIWKESHRGSITEAQDLQGSQGRAAGPPAPGARSTGGVHAVPRAQAVPCGLPQVRLL